MSARCGTHVDLHMYRMWMPGRFYFLFDSGTFRYRVSLVGNITSATRGSEIRSVLRFQAILFYAKANLNGNVRFLMQIMKKSCVGPKMLFVARIAF